MKSKIQKLVEEVEVYDHLTLASNIKERLQKTLTRYLEELDDASDRILSKKLSTVYRELSK